MSTSRANQKNIKETGITVRQSKILFALIKEYCETGETCGSKELKEKYNFDFSSATIRNETMYLREVGYLYQPFINSSSCPTEKAFKLFVNQLISGLTVANKHQQDMRNQILELQQKQDSMNKEITKLISMQTDSLTFAVSERTENITGMKHLFNSQNEDKTIMEVLDFLDNLDKHKHHLLNSEANIRTKKGKKMQTIFGTENTILPLGKGYALIATEVVVGNEKTVVGIISPTHLLTNPKKLSTLEAISKALE
jgi:transcriptional regulator of heat shock response